MDIEKQPMTTAEVTKTFSQSQASIEKFNVALRVHHTVQRRFSSEPTLPNLAAPSGAMNLNDHHGVPVVPVASVLGTVGLSQGGFMRSPSVPKVPLARFNNVHTLDDFDSAPAPGQCQFCRNYGSKFGSSQTLIQEQHTSMADSIRRPKKGRRNPDDELGDDSSSSSDRSNRRRRKKDLDDDDDGDGNDDGSGDEASGRSKGGHHNEDD